MMRTVRPLLYFRSKKFLRLLLWIFATLFFVMNAVAFMHAYKFTHFSDSETARTKDPKHLSFGAKLNALFFGVANPRPVNQSLPSQKFDTLQLQSNKRLECWSIRRDSTRHNPRGPHGGTGGACDSAKGTVILFHGYGGEKSSMLDKSDIFQQLGYNTLLVDFMGSGGSEGNRTTVGFREAEEVMTCYNYVAGKGENHIYLFGTSMGAVAILKAMKDYRLAPSGIMIECPFGTLYKTVCARFKAMEVPSFPMAGLLVFWGGVENGFWAFSHKPVEYARAVSCPTLLMYGEKDEKVSLEETEDLFANLHGRKKLCVFPFAGHENYLHQYRQEWTHDVSHFLSWK